MMRKKKIDKVAIKIVVSLDGRLFRTNRQLKGENKLMSSVLQLLTT
jgi:hypothetical protein